MSVGDVTTKYFSVIVAFGSSRLALPCVVYSSELKLKNYLNKCGIVLESCTEIA